VRLLARDCSPLDPQPDAEEVSWLRRVSREVRPTSHVVGLGGERDEDEPIVYCERDGTWWAGRYVGSVSLDGHRLTIEPRFGLDTLRQWLLQVLNIALVESPGEHREDESFVVQLLAAVWSRAFIEAARHGLPALRQEVFSTGHMVRGRLDVARSVRLLASGSDAVVSASRERSLDNALSRALVAAYAVLRRWMGPGTEHHWLPARAQDLLPHLLAVTGPRPEIPTELELKRVRYTPITSAFRPVAELSLQIAHRRGLVQDSTEEGAIQGVLLDVAELWELYVLAVLRVAAAGFEVHHGTVDPRASGALLESEVDQRKLGMLKPDALVLRNRHVVGVLDAKYKRLFPTRVSPAPQREDLYQLTSYLARYGQGGTPCWGALIYPQDQHQPGLPWAEGGNPWLLDPTRRVFFLTLPHQIEEATIKLRRVVFEPEAK
jgi:5-methylcytosine-specific restriction enzyme subunit McrC